MLIGIPPHRAPAALAESSLAGSSRFVPVDRHSLVTALQGVHAIGDASQIPLAGAGSCSRRPASSPEPQAGVVTERIACDLAGRDPRAADTPEVRMRRPGAHWHLAKAALERYPCAVGSDPPARSEARRSPSSRPHTKGPE